MATESSDTIYNDIEFPDGSRGSLLLTSEGMVFRRVVDDVEDLSEETVLWRNLVEHKISSQKSSTPKLKLVVNRTKKKKKNPPPSLLKKSFWYSPTERT